MKYKKEILFFVAIGVYTIYMKDKRVKPYWKPLIMQSSILLNKELIIDS